MSLNYAYDPQIWPAIITTGLAIFLAVYGWRRRNIPAARPFVAAVLCGALWAVGAALEVSALDFSTKVFWFEFQVIWQPLSAVWVSCFVIAYVGLGRWLNLRNLLLIFAIPMLNMLAIFTNGLYHLMWTGFTLNGHIIAEPGRLYWFFIGYVYLVSIVNFILLVRIAIISPRHRAPAAIMISGQLIVRLVYLLDKINQGLMGPAESVALVIGVAFTAYSLAFFRFHAIDPIAAARTAVLDQMHEAMLVIDLKGRIADLNAAAERILGMTAQKLRGRTLIQILPAVLSLAPTPGLSGTADREISLRVGNAARTYATNFTLLKDRSGEMLGRLLLLHDVTEQKRAQEKILEQQRTVATLEERERLARELHDGVGQVLGYVGMQAQTAATWLRNENKEKAESLMVRLAEVAKDAHADVRESILGLKGDPTQPWSFIPALRQYLRNFQTNYGIQTELSMPDETGPDFLQMTTAVQVLRVIQEALTNARKHSGAQNVKITFEQNDSRTLIKIIDNGTGFDPTQVSKDGSGHFGLVFMRERMGEAGGTLRIESKPGMGTMVEINIPSVRKQEKKI